MEKEEHIVMLVSKYTLFLYFFSLPFISLSQVNLIPKSEKAKKSWSFMVATGASKSKEPSGTTVVYPDYYVNLKIHEPFLFAYKVEVSQNRTSKKGLFISKGLGFSSYSYILNFDYDREASVGASTLSERWNFNYIYGSLKIGRPFHINNFSITPYTGVSLNFLVKAKFDHRDQGGRGKSSQTNLYKPWALGWELGSMFTYKIDDNTSLELRPSFNKIQKEYGDVTGSSERMVYSYTLGLAVIKKIKSKI